ncbi:MAG: hypothetical protein JNL74_09455, partial [Fibrobacteres bacterium]|nr:hypothetical protein [Fibrobacterota bacterium]
NEFTSLRLYNKDGVYNKTLFPYPSSLATSKKTPYGVVDFMGRTMPRVQRLYGPMITTTIAASDLSKLAEIDDPDGCWIFQGTENKMMMVGNDGGAKSTPVVPIVTSPRYPDHYKTGGSPHLTLSPDGKYLYFSGFFESVNSNNNDPITADTGFWRDGRVFRINATTGVATAFITMDSIPKTSAARTTIIGGSGRLFAAFAGIDFDAAGNLYVCDRLHGRVSVYDTSANLLGYVNVKYPEAVKVDRKSGLFYVLRWASTGYHAGDAVLFKFATYQGSPQPVCSLRVNGTGQGSFEGGSTFLALDNSGSSNILWCSDASIGIKRYVDNGNSFTLEQNWKTAHSADWGSGQYSTLGFDKIVVDRAKDIVYINNGNSGLCKVDNWKNPKVVPCSTSANRRLYAVDLAMSSDNQLYIVEGPNYTGPITRWASKAGKLDSIPFPNTGKNMATHEIYGRMHGVGGYGPKGMAVAPDKKIAVQYMYQFSRYFIGVFGDSGSADNIERCDTVMKPTCPDNGVGGAIRYDSKGNLYMGVAFHAPGFPEISAYPSGDETYSRYTGSIARIPKGNKGSHTA